MARMAGSKYAVEYAVDRWGFNPADLWPYGETRESEESIVGKQYR